MINSKLREDILRLLEDNAKYSENDIATMVGADVNDVHNEIADMEREHIICGYHALVNWDKTDDDKISALIELKVSLHRGEGFDRIAEKIYQYPEVETLFLMSGGYDFSVILKKATMREIANFVSTKLATIEEVQSTATHIVLVRYKDHGVSLMAQKKDQRMVVMP